MGGYTYAGDNPASSSDPTGYDPASWGESPKCQETGIGCGGGKKKSHGGGGTKTSSGSTGESPAPSTTPTPSMGPTPTSTQTPTPTLGETPCQPADFGTDRCESYDGGALIYTAVGVVGLPVAAWCIGTGVLDCVAGAFTGAADAEAGGSMLLGVRVVGLGVGAARAMEEGAAEGAAAGAEASAANEAADDAADLVAAKRANVQEHAAEAEAEATRPTTPEAGNAGTKPAESAARCSFSPDTPVLMAGGRTKAIGKIKTGDKVEAADQKTGKHAGPREVVATLVNHDKDLIDVKVHTSRHHTATLHTTSKHPFWDATAHAWVPAGKLKAGHALTTENGHHVHVAQVHVTPGEADRYNLTVRELHTYYVLAGKTPILVHNTCGGYRAEAEDAQKRAQALDAQRGWGGGTTAVIGVRNVDTGVIANRIAINGNRNMPKNWQLGSNEQFVRGSGHAEETIFNSLAHNEEVLYGGTSRNVCQAVCAPFMRPWSLRLDGQVFAGMGDKAAYRTFWRPWRY
ncbi:polymorphic toxin-type HINT domain-containing protein [Streptomyces lutosisoli]|uniref:Polymorphic toxin-type HINT domain-containing protein n=1 Tax=Streptomyces lutosisoli TaxID=2665721 RepID=A0ABW2VTW8_9ACTN